MSVNRVLTNIRPIKNKKKEKNLPGCCNQSRAIVNAEKPFSFIGQWINNSRIDSKIAINCLNGQHRRTDWEIFSYCRHILRHLKARIIIVLIFNWGEKRVVIWSDTLVMRAGMHNLPIIEMLHWPWYVTGVPRSCAVICRKYRECVSLSNGRAVNSPVCMSILNLLPTLPPVDIENGKLKRRNEMVAASSH